MKTTALNATILGAALAAAALPALAAPPGSYFDVSGDHIFYTVQGTGTPMLLVHGFPLSSGLFKFQQERFSGSYQVITVDLPGFGASSTATTQQVESHYAAEMLALLKHLGIGSAIIGGHSMGGQVVLDMYRQDSSVFKGMILFDTNPAPASIVEQAEWPAYGRMAQKMGSASIALPVVAVMVTGAAIAQRPDLQTYIAYIVASAKPNGVAGGGHALANRRDYRPLLATISVPTLVVEGQDDTVYPLPIAQKLAVAIPGATLAVIPASAHASMLQSYEQVNAAIASWLAKPPG